MLLTETRITEANLVTPESQVRLRNSTCDLTVGHILPTGKNKRKTQAQSDVFWLKPNHMVYVVTQQRVRLPANVTGLASLVTTLTKDGLLCLNTGIIDPGYDGHLGATLVNFSNKQRRVALNDRLFRVLFFEHEEIKELSEFRIDRSDYIKTSKQKSEDEFNSTFLDVQGLLEQAEKSAWAIVMNKSTANIIPWVALAVATIGSLFGILAYFK